MSTKPKHPGADLFVEALRGTTILAFNAQPEGDTIDKPNEVIDKIKQLIKDYGLKYHVIAESRKGNHKYIEFQISIKL